MTFPTFPSVSTGEYWTTLPIIDIDSGTESRTIIDLVLQQNVSDLVYGVFYAAQSPFKIGFDSGYVEGDLFSALMTALETVVSNYETLGKSKRYNYVIDSVNVSDFSIVVDTVKCKLTVTSGALVLPVGIKVTKSLI